jgi:hypothetical protein
MLVSTTYEIYDTRRWRMPDTLKERDWEILLGRIRDGKCTPFLGAGACYPALRLGSEIAREWAQQYEYPFRDTSDLARVAQFLAVRYDPMYPKEEILSQFFQDVEPPNFSEPDEPHGLLADLPLPVYMTTNYDDFMVQALRSRSKDPQRELCRWNKYVTDEESVFSPGNAFDPTPAHPVVFHLHGHNEVPESLVLAEGDYLDFLVNVSRDGALLPPRIQKALTGASPLFIGYALEDWSFRVLFQGLVMSMASALRRISVTVQLPPPKLADEVHLKSGDIVSGKITGETEAGIVLETEAMGSLSISKEFVEHIISGNDDSENAKAKQQEYLGEYFGKMDVRVYWGTGREFTAELRRRWREFSHAN